MESLDFVIDLTENLEKQNIDYFLVALRKNGKGSKADVFYRMSDQQSVVDMCEVLDTLKDDIQEIEKPIKKTPTPKKKKASKKPRRKKRGRPRKDDSE